MDIYAAWFGPKRRNHVIAADHCDNHGNKGACRWRAVEAGAPAHLCQPQEPVRAQLLSGDGDPRD